MSKSRKERRKWKDRFIFAPGLFAQEERIEPFPLKDVFHPSLKGLIAEKFLYNDFVNFHKVSRFSAEMCEKVPKYVRPVAKVFDVCIRETFNFIKVSEWTTEVVYLEKLNENVRIECEQLRIRDEAALKIIEKHEIKTKHLFVFDLHLKPDFVKKVLLMTEARELTCSPSSKQILNMDEVRQLDFVSAHDDDELDDHTLLNIKARSMCVYGFTRLTYNGIVNFIEQWKNGEREIDEMELYVYGFSMKEYRSSLSPDSYTQNIYDPDVIYLYRNDGDCIQLDGSELNWPNVLFKNKKIMIP